MTDTQFHLASIASVIALSWLSGSLWVGLAFIVGWCIGWARRRINDEHLMRELIRFREYLREI